MAKVKLYGRIYTGDGKAKWVAVEISANHRPLPVKDAFGYYIQFTEKGKQRQVSCATTDVTLAFASMRRKEAELAEGGVPGHTLQIIAPAAPLSLGRTLSEAIQEWVTETEANKARKTYLAYKNSGSLFERFCGKAFVQQVDRKDMLAFKTFLRDEGHSKRTVYNNFLNTMIFLKWAGVQTGVTKSDWATKPERDPEEYTDAELTTLLQTAQPSERILLHSFLCTGFRSGEIANLTYADINFATSIWRVAEKETWDAKTDGSVRSVTVPEWLTKKIEQRMQAANHKKPQLVFPSPRGGVDGHLLRIVQRVAERAGLTEIRVDDHKFRSTAITRWLREGNSVQDVMAWVGHKSLSTILRYAAKVRLEQDTTKAKAHAPFAKFAAVGD